MTITKQGRQVVLIFLNMFEFYDSLVDSVLVTPNTVFTADDFTGEATHGEGRSISRVKKHPHGSTRCGERTQLALATLLSSSAPICRSC